MVPLISQFNPKAVSFPLQVKFTGPGQYDPLLLGNDVKNSPLPIKNDNNSNWWLDIIMRGGYGVTTSVNLKSITLKKKLINPQLVYYIKIISYYHMKLLLKTNLSKVLIKIVTNLD